MQQRCARLHRQHRVEQLVHDELVLVEIGHRLPASVQIQIYRVAQEALSNICRHANAKHVKMSVDVSEAESMPGVKAVYHARGNDLGLPTFQGFPMMPPTLNRPVFANDVVSVRVTGQELQAALEDRYGPLPEPVAAAAPVVYARTDRAGVYRFEGSGEPVDVVREAVVGDDRRDCREEADRSGDQRFGDPRRDLRQRGLGLLLDRGSLKLDANALELPAETRLAYITQTTLSVPSLMGAIMAVGVGVGGRRPGHGQPGQPRRVDPRGETPSESVSISRVFLTISRA